MKAKSKYSYSPTGRKDWAPLNTFMFKKGGKPISEVRKQPGSSNAGKYSKSEGPFCGPSGGAAKGTYPIGSKDRGRSALKLAHNAPNPQGIKNCVYNKYSDLKKEKAIGGLLKTKNKADMKVKVDGKKPKEITIESNNTIPVGRGKRAGGKRNGTGPRAKLGLCRRSKFSKKCGGKVK